MIYIPNSNHEASLNLAMEEYLLTASGITEPMLFFYINAPSVIIGRHQNTVDEINEAYIQEHGIRVVRRCSGGGAVYHDLGNLNYSLITPGAVNASANFSKLLQPILRALHRLGLPAELSGRNDLIIDGAKFSGNAYYHNRHGDVIHGTLLYDTDLHILSHALKPNPIKLKSKGIESVRSRVCCIKEYLTAIPDIDSLREAIVHSFSGETVLLTREFSAADMGKIEELADMRYRNAAWNYGESPAYNIRRTIRMTSGWIDFRACIHDGKIISAKFYGDYFCDGDIEKLEESLIDTPWDPDPVTAILMEAGWEKIFPDLQITAVISALFSGKEDA